MKSIIELRADAQALGVEFTFADSALILEQKISMRVEEKYKPDEPPPAYIPQDGRFRNKPPTRETDEDTMREVLSEFIKRGLVFTVDQDTWHMRLGKQEDSGTMRCQPRDILNCARRMF